MDFQYIRNGKNKPKNKKFNPHKHKNKKYTTLQTNDSSTYLMDNPLDPHDHRAHRYSW